MATVIQREPYPKVKVSDGLLPAHQHSITSGTESWFTIPATPAFPSNLIGSGNSAYLDIERDEVGHIMDVCIRFSIKNNGSSSVQLVPPAYWFSRIVLESEKGSGDEVQHIYSEDIAAWFWLTMTEEERSKWADFGNFHIEKFNSEYSERYYDSQKQIFQPGETRDVYIPIPSIFVHLQALDFKFIRSDFRIRMEMSSDVLLSGTLSDLSLQNTHLLARCFNEESYDFVARQNTQRSNDQKYIYLDVERLQFNDKTLTASASTRLPLDQFVGKSPFLLVYIKNGSNPTGRNKYKFVEIGKNGTLDIENSSSQSLMGQGTALKQDHIYKIFSDQLDSPNLKGVYLIPFTESISKSMSGKICGFMDFVGVKDYLNITFGDSGQSEQVTITTESLGVTGSYRYATTNGIIQETNKIMMK